MRTFVAGQCEQDNPFAFVGEEWSNAVFAHIRSYGYRVYVQFFKESTCIHGRGITDVAAFGIGDDKLVGIVLLDVVHGLFKGNPAFYSHALIESEIRFVGDTQVGCCIDNRFVEGKDGVFFFQQVFRNLFDIRVQTYA